MKIKIIEMGISETLKVLTDEETLISEEVLIEGIKELNPSLQERLFYIFVDKNIKKGIYSLIEVYHTFSPRLQNLVLKEHRSISGFLHRASHDIVEQTRLNTLDIIAKLFMIEYIKIVSKTISDSSESIQKKSIEAFREIVLACVLSEKKQIDSGTLPYSDFLVLKRQSLIEGIITALKDYEKHRAKELLELLLTIRFEAYDVLYTILLEEDSTLKKDLIGVLRYQNSEEVALFLITLLNTKNSELVLIADELLVNKLTEQFANSIAGALKKLDQLTFKTLSSSTREIKWWKIIEPYISAFSGQINNCLIEFILNSKISNEDKITLFEKFLSLEDETIQVYTLYAMQQLPSIHTIPIVKRYINSQNEQVALIAIENYLKSNPDDIVEVLTPLLSSKIQSVRKIAAREISGDSFNRYIMAFDNMDEKTRRIAASAIAKIDESMAEKIAEELNSLDSDRRIKALRIVEMMGKEKEVEPAILSLINDPDKKVRATAVKVIGLLGTVDALRVLIKMLADPDRRTRANSVEAFEELGDSRFAPLLLPFLEDPDNRVRANAAKALWNLGYKQVKDTLETMLNSEDEKMRLSAVWALGEINYPGAKSLLKSISESDSSEVVRKKALSILEKEKEK